MPLKANGLAAGLIALYRKSYLSSSCLETFVVEGTLICSVIFSTIDVKLGSRVKLKFERCGYF